MKRHGFLIVPIVLLSIMIACICLLSPQANAASTSDLTFILSSDGESYSVTDCKTSSSGSLTIPSTYNGKPVISIGDWAFRDCTSLISVTIPDSITSIGRSAFSGCSNLETMTIPFVGSSRKTAEDTYQYPLGYLFGTNSYAGGTATEQRYYGSSDIPTSTTYYIPKSLKHMTVTSGNILYGAFYNCSNLTSINISDSVTSIGMYAFYGCSKLQYNTYGGAKYLGNDSNPYVVLVTAESTSVSSVNVQKDTKIIYYNAFSDCADLTSITIPNSVTSIGARAFYRCSGLTSVTIGNGVTSIGNDAFYYCTGLTSITIPDGVTSIGDFAFYNCSSLTSVNIPDSVTIIYGDAFYGCSKLQYNTYGGAKYLGNDSNPYVVLVTAESTSVSSVNVQKDTKIIYYNAFSDCADLTSITIPDSITYIGAYAFYPCKNLTSVHISDIAAWCSIYFDYSDEEFYIVTGNPLNSANLYLNGSLVTELGIPEGVTHIGRYAFMGNSFTSVTIPDSVISIGERAFGDSGSLETVIIGNNITKIDEATFFNCINLTSITIPGSVTSIGDYAFRYCDTLSTVVYCGTPEQWRSVSIGSENQTLKAATRQFHNYENGICTICQHLADYTVTFKNWDGSVLSSETYHWGDKVTAPTNPTRAADNIYTYTFNGWDKVVVDCVGNATYTATYTPTYIDYTVVFKDWDGTVLSSKTHHWGDKATAPSNLTRAADNTYTYAFAGWDKEVVNCAGNATYIATYDAVYIDYTVEFKDWNGNVLSSNTYHWGDAVAEPATPTKPADNTYSYAFVGWDKDVAECAGNTTYTAIYTPTYINYTITFKNWDGTVLSSKSYHYGDKVTAPSNPTRVADNTYSYTFVSWNTEITDCLGDAVYTTIYSATYINYTVVFKDCDGNVLSSNTYHWGDEVTIPVNPTKAADNTYTYAFKGWDKAVVNCAGNATYTATYTSNYIDYTVTFQDWDGTVLSTNIYHWGDTVPIPVNPTKAADNTYSYTFAGWDKDVVNCAGNATYTATYKSNYIDYVVKFLDEDGTVLSVKTYHWGDKVTAPAAPTKAADNTYTYTFAGWDKEIANCAGNTTYTATYTPNYIDYAVVFKDWNGTVISTKTYHYGDNVEVPADPTRAADNTYTYVFVGWDKTVVNCAGNATYTATYTSTYIDYTVVFKDWDGTVLSTKVYHYGDTVTEPATPTKPADETYTYAFAAWDKEVVSCAGNAIYTATYSPSYINYTVEFQNWNGDVLSTKTYHYGDKVTAPNDPTRAEDDMYTYTFAGWDKTIVNCAGNVTYTATYTPNYIDYVVVFQDWDGTVLSSKTYHYGDKVTAPANPSRVADNTYTYAFTGWDKDVVNCAGNITYTAQYTANYINYTIVFKNWDGTVLFSDTYHWGNKVIAPADPIKAADNTYTYTFKGWDKEIVNCAGDAIYTATYKANYIDYTIVFKDWNGYVLSAKTYHYGDKVTEPANPTRVADKTYTYTFAGWDKAVVNCAGDSTYTATYTPNYIDYTVVFKNWDGTVLSEKSYHYGDTVSAPTDPTRPDDDTYIYTFTGWDKTVVACNGDAVYVAVYSKATRVPSTITSPNYTVSGGTISNISTNTTVSALVGKLNEKEYVKVYNGNQEVSGNTLIGTGMVVKVMDGNTVKASVTVVVTGDTNGDGKITITDMLASKAHLLKKSNLQGAAGQAADTNGDGTISITDFIQMKAHILGKSNVEPKSVATQTTRTGTAAKTAEVVTDAPAVTARTTVYTVVDAMVPKKQTTITV